MGCYTSGQHLQPSVFHFLHSFIRGLQYLPCLLGNRNVRYPVELIWRYTTKNSIKCFAICNRHREGCLIPYGFGSLWPSLFNIHRIPNGFIH